MPRVMGALPRSADKPEFRFGAMNESNKQKLGISSAEATAARSRVAGIW